METTKKGKPKAKGNGQGTIYKMSNGKFRGQLTIGYNENGSPKRKSFTGKTKKKYQIK